MRATATKTGWFQTEENWVRVHVFWDYLNLRAAPRNYQLDVEINKK